MRFLLFTTVLAIAYAFKANPYGFDKLNKRRLETARDRDKSILYE